MNIEEVMEVYFNKQAEFDKKYKKDNSIIEKCLEEKRFIELRLERLRENKEQEIEQYISNVLSPNRPDFGYMIRRDLEQSYANKELELETRLNELDKEIKAQESKIPSEIDKFYRLDVREIVEIKQDLRKNLMAAKKELELKLEEVQVNSSIIMLKLSKFQHVYDENHRVLNGDEYKSLFDQSHSLVEVKYNLQNQLNKVNEYLELTELTKEEGNIIMMSMTPWEKEEYDRRKNLNKVEEIENIETDENISEEVEEEISADEKEEEVEELPAEELEETKENNDEFNGAKDLLETIFVDVMQCAKNLRSVKLDNRYLTTKDSEGIENKQELDTESKIETPNGIYLNEKDLKKALDNYGKQSKGRTFKVKGIDKTFEITKKTIKKVKKGLRDCAIVKLLREKKLGSFDIKRVYGKLKGEEYRKKAEIGKVETTMPEGNYINIRDFSEKFKELLVEKGPTWIERLTKKLKNKAIKEQLYITESSSKTKETSEKGLELDDDYKIVKSK